MADPVQAVLDPFLADVDRVLLDRYSAVLYGSAARGDFVKGRSDINVLMVLDDVGPAVLRSLAGAFGAWRKAAQEPPLLLSRTEWLSAADSFPIEISDMRASYRVLRGADPLALVTVETTDLRRALEREFRGKLLRLRQGYVTLSSDAAALSGVAQESVGTMLVLYRALLALLGHPVPGDSGALVTAAAAAVGFAPTALIRIVAGRADRNWRCTTMEFEAYVDAVAQTAAFVDHLQLGDQ
jgi:predicted nucleotidyltransferase